MLLMDEPSGANLDTRRAQSRAATTMDEHAQDSAIHHPQHQRSRAAVGSCGGHGGGPGRILTITIGCPVPAASIPARRPNSTAMPTSVDCSNGLSQGQAMNRAGSVTLIIAGFFVVWELGVRISGVPNYILPSRRRSQSTRLRSPWYARHAAYTVGSCVRASSGVGDTGGDRDRVFARPREHAHTLLVSLNDSKIARRLHIIWMGTVRLKVAISMLIALFAIVIDTVLGRLSTPTCSTSRNRCGNPFRCSGRSGFPRPAGHVCRNEGHDLAGARRRNRRRFVASQVGLGYAIWPPRACSRPRVFAAIVLGVPAPCCSTW